MSTRAAWLRVAMSSAAAMVAMFVTSLALAEETPTLLHLRLSVGPAAILGGVEGKPRVESSTREATGRYTTGYAGSGIALEIGPGLTHGAGTYEILATSVEWYGVTYFNTDDHVLQRMNVQLEPKAFVLTLGFGGSWPIVQDSVWRFGAGFRFVAVTPQLETPEGNISNGDSGLLVAMASIGPRWPILRTGPRDANAITFGVHARVLAGFFTSALGSVALMTDLAFQ